MLFILLISLLISFVVSAQVSPSEQLTATLEILRNKSSLMGLSVEVSQCSEIVYKANIGLKDNKTAIQNSTMFRMASLSKSFVSVAIMQLVEQGKVRINQSVSQILGFPIRSPYYPDTDITLQMVMTHRSSIVECSPYFINFLQASYYPRSGNLVPHLKQILQPGGKYYNPCLFTSYKPGQYFQYGNLNYGIAATVVQKLSNVQFNIYQHQYILQHISVGQPENATFYGPTIRNISHLGVIYVGNHSQWQVSYDYYPSGEIPTKNLTGYIVGTNGLIFAPQAGLRASVSHFTNYMIMLRNKGVTKEGKKILSEKSVEQLMKPRYQFHGKKGGHQNDMMSDVHNYGLGFYRTSYRVSDQVISHKVVQGHLGDNLGLISAYFFWENYTMTYVINGALHGYSTPQGNIYEGERNIIHRGVQKFISLQNKRESSLAVINDNQ